VAAVDFADREGPRSALVSAVAPASQEPSSAAFLGIDTTTSGHWGGTYGSDGFLMPAYFFGQDCKALPDYLAAVDYGTLALHPFTLLHRGQPAALDSSSLLGGKSGLGVLWTAGSDTLTLWVRDAAMHRLALYLCDSDKHGGGRNQDIEILDLAGKVLAPAQNVADFQNGKWLNYQFSGSIKIRLTNRNPKANAVISAIMFDGVNLAEGKAYSASSEWSAEFAAAKAFDGDITTRWSAASGDVSNSWLQVDFGAPNVFNEVTLRECLQWNQTTSFEIQYWDGAAWQVAHRGTRIGHVRVCTFNPVKGSKMRILFTSMAAGGYPSIWQVQVRKHSP
jgi:hypothetical protein